MDSIGGVTITTQKDIDGLDDDDDLSTLAEEQSIRNGYGSGTKDVKDITVETHVKRASTSSAPTSPVSPSRRSFSFTPPSPPEAIAMSKLTGK